MKDILKGILSYAIVLSVLALILYVYAIGARTIIHFLLSPP